jgi:hypothetical protein
MASDACLAVRQAGNCLLLHWIALGLFVRGGFDLRNQWACRPIALCDVGGRVRHNKSLLDATAISGV